MRLRVFRSNKHIYGQLIDETGKTVVSLSDFQPKADPPQVESDLVKTEKAKRVGFALAKKALELKIETVVFDRSKFRYHGRVKALAEGAREGGLKF